MCQSTAPSVFRKLSQLICTAVSSILLYSTLMWLCVLTTPTGKPLKGYPMALPSGAIASASVLLADLHDYSKEARLKTSKMSRDKVLDPSMSPWMAHYYGYEPPPSRAKPAEMIAVETIDANGTVHVTEVLTSSEKKKSRLVRTS